MTTITESKSAVNKKRITLDGLVGRNNELIEHLVFFAILKSSKFFRRTKSQLFRTARLPGRFDSIFTSRYSRLADIFAQFWTAVPPVGDACITPEWLDIILAKKVENKRVSPEEAAEWVWQEGDPPTPFPPGHAGWLLRDLRDTEIDREVLERLPDHEVFRRWVAHRVINYQLSRLDSVTLGHAVEAEDVRNALREIEACAAPAPLKSLFDFAASPEDEVIGPNRWLCRKGGALLVSQTGAGKSVLVAQMALSFAVGRGSFGLMPARPLKVLIIQAENDDGDLASFREGVLHRLKLTEPELALARANVMVVTERSRTGTDFLGGVVATNLELFQPNLVIIDPVLSYLGGEASAQLDVGKFLRNGLNPLLEEHNCAVIVVHHVPKPTRDGHGNGYLGQDFSYSAFGSVEWSNWARAILTLHSTKTEGTYLLRAPKRGGRLGWVDPQSGEATTRKYVAWSREPGCYYWIETSNPDAGAAQAEQQKMARLLALIPDEGLATGAWEKAAKTELGMPRSTFFRHRDALENQGRVCRGQAGLWLRRPAIVKLEAGGGGFLPGKETKI